MDHDSETEHDPADASIEDEVATTRDEMTIETTLGLLGLR